MCHQVFLSVIIHTQPLMPIQSMQCSMNKGNIPGLNSSLTGLAYPYPLEIPGPTFIIVGDDLLHISLMGATMPRPSQYCQMGSLGF